MPVNSLLNFNGADGATVFTDNGLSPSVWTSVTGAPVLSTTQKKFNVSSLSLDGSSGLRSTINLSDDSIDFTIEMFFRMNSVAGVQTICFLSETEVVGLLTLSGQLYYYDAPNGGWLVSLNELLLIDVWYHCSLSRSNGVLTVGLNGNNKIAINSSIASPITSITLGSRSVSFQQFLNGYIDSFRLTVGESLYNYLSNENDIPQIEPTTTILSTLPILPTNMKSTPNVFKSLGNPPVYKQGTSINGSGTGGEVIIDPTSTNIISGNVEKLGLPFGANIAIVSLGLNAEVVGTGVSDPVTGDYSIDVYPHTDEVLIYVAPDYGKVFVASGLVSVGEIVHPVTPNRYVYICTVAGNLGSVEPTWGTEGLITSGGVTFNTVPLHRPLMNGFIKPVITPI